MMASIGFLLLGMVGGMVAGLFTAFFFARPLMGLIRTELRSPGLQLRDVEITVNVVTQGEDFEGRSSVQWSGEEIEGIAVDKWLEQRGLIAQPRGVDFKVKRREGQA